MNGSRIFKFANHLCNTETSLPLSSTTTTRILQLKWCITSSSCKPNAVSRPSIRAWLAPKFNPAEEEAGQNCFHLNSKEPDWSKHQDFYVNLFQRKTNFIFLILVGGLFYFFKTNFSLYAGLEITVFTSSPVFSKISCECKPI